MKFAYFLDKRGVCMLKISLDNNRNSLWGGAVYPNLRLPGNETVSISIQESVSFAYKEIEKTEWRENEYFGV
jgi:hypothetical protein